MIRFMLELWLLTAAPVASMARGDTQATPIPLEPAYHGTAVDSAGDVDLDGSSDVIVGAWWDEGRKTCGSATVFSGKTGQRLFVLRGDQQGALHGLTVAGGGDVDGDGTPDVIVGAPFQNWSFAGFMQQSLRP